MSTLTLANGASTKAEAHDHLPSGSVVLAVLGTLQMEFTRLSQITGNMKYYSAVQRIVDELEKWQNKTALPGMWPAMVDATGVDPIALSSSAAGSVEKFTLGALADSTYEYLPKVCRCTRCKSAITLVTAIHHARRPVTAGPKAVRDFRGDCKEAPVLSPHDEEQ
jgi:hypothetical protein